MTAVAHPALGENVLREKRAGESSSRQKRTKTLSQFVPVLDARISNINAEKCVVLNKMALLNNESRPKYLRVPLFKYHRRKTGSHWGQRQGRYAEFYEAYNISLA